MEKTMSKPTDTHLAGTRRWALASVALSVLLSSLGISIANVGLPTLAQAFGVPFQSVQWVVLAYLLAVSATVVGIGRLGDMVGRRRLLLAGLGLYTAASALCGVAPALELLLAARAVQGLGAAAMMALAMAFVGDIVPKDRTGSAMGLLGTMSAVGTALGPSLGGLLIAVAGWPALFLATAPFAAAALVLAHRHLPADRPRPTGAPARFDFMGSLLLGATLAAYALAMTLGRGGFGTVNAALLTAALLGAGAFVAVERRAAAPLVRLDLLRDPVLAPGLAMNALVSTVLMATLVVGPFYLSRGLGLDAAAVGLAVSAGPVVSALAGVPAGRLADRFGAARMTVVSLGGIAGGFAVLSALPASFGIPGYVGPIVVVTAGYALFQAANNTAVMAEVPQDRRGVVSGLLNLSRNLGLVTGAAALGAVFAAAVGTGEVSTAPAAAVAAGMHVTFAVAAALVAVALALGIAGRIAASPRPASRDVA